MIIKPVSRLVQELDAKSFTVIGCPCADGLGSEALQIFHAALAGAEGDFIVILGDVSPLGRDPYYRQVARFIDATARKPVYVLPGSRDGEAYGEYFGHENSAVLSEEFVLIMLDNSGGSFSEETLKFLQETMAIVDSHNVVIAFHTPPPNRMSGDSMAVDDWHRFDEAVGVWRNRISLLVCGRTHTYFEDDVDGLPLVVTGGGGAGVRKIERVRDPHHHALEIDMDRDGRPRVRRRALAAIGGGGRDAEIEKRLAAMYASQCRAHVDSLLAAEDAAENARPHMARMYRTAARSSLRQARIVHQLLRRDDDPATAAREGVARFGEDAESGRSARITAAEKISDVLAVQAMRGVGSAERVAAGMLEKALHGLTEDGDVPAIGYYVCQSCGMIFSGDAPSYCSECGAPEIFLRESD